MSVRVKDNEMFTEKSHLSKFKTATECGGGGREEEEGRGREGREKAK